MVPRQDITVQPLERRFLEDAVRVHRRALGYTLNSLLGTEHMLFLYNAMMEDKDSYAAVAIAGEKVVGVVSGTAHLGALRARLMGQPSLGQKVRFLQAMLLQPGLINKWWKVNRIAAPISYLGQPVNAILTAIAVDPDFRGGGVGQRLVAALEASFRARGIGTYRLDTLSTNGLACRFYERLGFRQVAVREDSIILVKMIPT